MLNADLWRRSGHWDNYKENMYFTEIDGQEFAVKPMNCPGGMLVYKTRQHSYRELPLRMGELGQVHRHELHGALHGLMRVRTFTQDDAHIFLTMDQVKDEVIGIIDLANEIYDILALNIRLSSLLNLRKPLVMMKTGKLQLMRCAKHWRPKGWIIS